MDKKDIRIMELLSINCRFSIKSLARALNMSKDTVRYRIRNLIKNGFIYKFLALVNFSALGYDQYYVGLQLQNLTSRRERSIVKELKKHPFVFFLVRTSGRFDFYLGLACKGVKHFDRVLRDVYDICGHNLMDIEPVTWIKDYRYTHTIEGMDLGTGIDCRKRDSSFSRELYGKRREFDIKSVKINRKDLDILKELSDEPRIELKRLGERVGLTGEAVRNRISRLIRDDALLGFTAIPHFFNLGYQTYFLLLGAKNLTEENEKLLCNFLHRHKYVAISFKVIGKYDILISVSVKNLKEFNAVLTEIRDELSGIIKTYESLALLDWYKYELFPEGMTKSL